MRFYYTALGGQDDAEQPIVLQARDEHQGELFFNEFVDIVSPLPE